MNDCPAIKSPLRDKINHPEPDGPRLVELSTCRTLFELQPEIFDEDPASPVTVIFVRQHLLRNNGTLEES